MNISVCVKNNITLNDVNTNNMKEILEITNNKLVRLYVLMLLKISLFSKYVY